MESIPEKIMSSSAMEKEEDNTIPLYAAVDKSRKAEQIKVPTYLSSDTGVGMYDVLSGERSSPEFTAGDHKNVSNGSKENLNSCSKNFEYGHVVSKIKDKHPSAVAVAYILLATSIICSCVIIIVLVAILPIIFFQLSALKIEVNLLKNNKSILQELATSQEKMQDNVLLQLNTTVEHFILPYINFLNETVFMRTDSTNYNIYPSCCYVLFTNPFAESGYYWISLFQGPAKLVYCDISSCETNFAGWTNIAFLNMANIRESCPGNLSKITFTRIPYCKLNEPSGACFSVLFSINETYENITGTIRGYGSGSLDGFNEDKSEIDEIYLDGVSLSYFNGNNRTHIWSFIAHAFCDFNNKCPVRDPPPFVNNTFTCDIRQNYNTLWNDSPCGATNSSWFFTQLNEPTESEIELRLCRDGNRTDEDIGISYIELYVQ